MKIKNDFIIREIAGEYIVIPTGRAVLEFNGLVTVNEIGIFLWRLLQEEITLDQLVQAVLDEYDVDAETAREDILEFLEKLEEHNILKKEGCDGSD